MRNKNMKLAIMQPYFFPYICYWQAIAAVDKYVVYDDVNYIKGGWVNRNRILVGNSAKFVTLALDKSSPYKKINEIDILQYGKQNAVNAIENAYRKAPYFKEIFPFIKSIIANQEPNLAEYLYSQIKNVANYLNITTKLLLSSRDVEKDSALKGQEKVLDICKRLGATQYINAIGGQELYSASEFEKNGIALNFLKTHNIEYKQFDNTFVPNLSILDALMFNPVENVKRMLSKMEFV
ncbi:MAG: WbqC family protein [Endomicrobium sp.]|jgi:hypothetical protein|nr:WbqC family protein [Endomicrobium sp.]